jgi:TrmH family RNA methyltransferase
MTGVFALEIGGTPIDSFDFPPSGVVLVGSEELGLSPEALQLADRQCGRVSIPLGGAKRSLNVSVAFGILMHAWHRALTQGAR